MKTNKFLLISLSLLCIFNLRNAQVPNNLNFYIGDFNGDGRSDYLKQEKGSLDDDNRNTARVYLATRRGFNTQTLPESYQLKGDFTNLFIGDFNGDGRDDFLRQEKGSWDDDNSGTADVFLSLGRGNFRKVNLAEDYNLKGDLTNLYIGDFNGDGRADILRQEKGTWDDDDVDTAYLLLATGQGRFRKIVLSEDYALKGDFTNLYIGDFNGDGWDDILRQEKGAWDDDDANTAYLLLSQGNGNFQKIVLSEDHALKGDFTNLYIGDFNGDGYDDILRQEKGAWDDDDANTAYLLLSDGNGGFTKYVLSEDYALKGDFTNLYVGDFNGDGNDDILRQEKGAWDDDNVNTAYLLFSNGDGTFEKIVLNENLNIKGDKTKLYIGDFNDDGMSDFLKYYGNDQSTVYLSRGDGRFRQFP